MTADEARAELCAVPRAQFVRRRGELVRAAREAGDRDLATAVAAMRKPTVVAWLLDAVARDDPNLVDQIARVGEALQQAHRELDGERLRTLGRERQELTGLVIDAARHAPGEERVGDAVADQIDRAVRLAISDVELLARWQSATLVDLPTPGTDDLPAPSTSAPARAQADAVRRRAAARALEQAERAVADATRRVDDLVDRARDLMARRARLERAAQEVAASLDEAQREHRDALAELERAEQQLRTLDEPPD